MVKVENETKIDSILFPENGLTQVRCNVGLINGKLVEVLFPTIYWNGRAQEGTIYWTGGGFVAEGYDSEIADEVRGVLDSLEQEMVSRYGIELVKVQEQDIVPPTNNEIEGGEV